MLLAGIFLGIYALKMDISVAVDYPTGNSFGFPDRVNNLGLMNDRQNYLIVAGVLSLLGVIIAVSSKSSSSIPEEIEGNNKKCPQCAESVKSEAKICRFCNYEFPNENISVPPASGEV